MKKIFFCVFAALAAFALFPSFSEPAESGNICNEGCALDSGCGNPTPYLCKKSWALDACVAKGYDSGYCGGKTDEGGYCFECSQGCALDSGCAADKPYICRKSWAFDECKPKYSDMGCCGGPPSGGDRTTFLKASITNSKADACTDKIKWEVKEKNSANFADYSADCVEGNPEVTIGSGKSMEATCTSQKLPSAASGPHKERITWCGESMESEYGHAPGAPDVQILWPEERATVSRQYKNTFAVKIVDDDIENGNIEKINVKMKFDGIETTDFTRTNEPSLPGVYLTVTLPSKTSTTIAITVTNSKLLSTSVSASLKLEDKYVLVFQPIGWTSDWTTFDAMVDRHVSKILENTPLKTCPNKLKVIKSHQNYPIDRSKLNNDCWMYFYAISDKIRAFVASNYDEYGTIIAVGDDLSCSDLAGMTISSDFIYNLRGNVNDIGNGGNPGEVTTLHELGHTWGFVEQYDYDIQKSMHDNYPNPPKEDFKNPLQSGLNCNLSLCEQGEDRNEFYDNCFPDGSLRGANDNEACKIKTKDCCCVLEPFSGKEYCAGNVAKDSIGRSFMGWTSFKLTGFDENEWNHINSIPVLNCNSQSQTADTSIILKYPESYGQPSAKTLKLTCKKDILGNIQSTDVDADYETISLAGGLRLLKFKFTKEELQQLKDAGCSW